MQTHIPSLFCIELNSNSFFRFSDAKKPAFQKGGLFLNKFRRRPTFPHGFPCSIISAVGLNFCVRDGNRCDPYAIATEKLKFLNFRTIALDRYVRCAWQSSSIVLGSRGEANFPPSSLKLFMVKPHGRLVPVS